MSMKRLADTAQAPDGKVYILASPTHPSRELAEVVVRRLIGDIDRNHTTSSASATKLRTPCTWLEMPSFGRVIQSLRSFRIQGLELPTTAPLSRKWIRSVLPVGGQSADLSLMLENFTGGFKGLPQEIVDEILEYLENDPRTLKACSLACKGLFCSARRIIHRKLCVVGPGKVFTRDEQEMRRCGAANRSQLRTLSEASKCGLAHYTRGLTIRIAEEFTPENLQPYLPQFQSFARLTTLTLHEFDPAPFLPVFEQYFGHLAQQIRSLEFVHPPGPQNDLMYFICQFPNLEDLGFTPFPAHNLNPSNEYSMSSIRRSPTLRGTLRVTSTNSWRTDSLECLTRLPSGFRFHSITFLHCTMINPDIIIRECTSTLESLTHVFHDYGAVLRFDLSTCSRLRIFELRLEPLSYIFHDFVVWLASVINTITSPAFFRFVLTVDRTRFHFGTNGWGLADRALSRLSQQTGMKMIVRGKTLRGTSCEVVENSFPLMVSAGAFKIELDD